MSGVHKCSLPQKPVGLPKLAPNASCFRRMVRALRSLIILNPKYYRCNAIFPTTSAVLQEQRRHIESPYRYIVHPFSTLNAFLEILYFVVWLLRMLYAPTKISATRRNDAIEYIENCSTYVVQPLLIMSTFFVGYVDKDNMVVLQHSKIVLRYLTTYFLFDLGATKMFDVCVQTFFLVFMEEGDTKWRLSQVIGYADSWCLYIRLPCILEYLDDVGQMLGFQKRFRMCVKYVVQTFMFLHILACMTYFIPQIVYYKDWPRNSWIISAGIELNIDTLYGAIYGECLLITTCYFFGASPGWHAIYQTNEQIYLAFITLFGRLYTLFLLADILKLFGIVSISESNYEKQRMKIREYMMHHNLSNHIRRRIVMYYEHKLQKRYFNEYEILSSLSDRLRAEIFLFSSKKMVKKTSIFQHLPQADLTELVSMMQMETFAPGDVIFTSGQMIEAVYFISSGTIAVLSKEGHELAHLEDGDVFGLSRTLTGESTHSCVAVESIDVFSIPFKELKEFLEQFPIALGHLNQLVKKRMASYNRLELNALSKNDTCIMELKKGMLLEKRKMRTLV